MKVQFLSELDVRKIENDGWQLLADFKAEFIRGEYTLHICVPTGFKTDFASVPRLPLAYLLAGDTTHKAPVLHDWLYSIGQAEWQRKEADEVFLAAMKAEGISLPLRQAMYAMVRVFGGSHFEEREEPAIQELPPGY